MVLINSDACNDNNVFYRGFCDKDYHTKYSSQKEVVIFSEDLCNKELSLYKVYDYKFVAPQLTTGGVSKVKKSKVEDISNICSEIKTIKPREEPIEPITIDDEKITEESSIVSDQIP
mgnify:CR=1 FL=1